jgi:hypothetical protein
MQRPAAHNADIARVFGEIADLLEFGQANPFRIPWRDTEAYQALAKRLGVRFLYSEKQAREATSEVEKLGAA